MARRFPGGKADFTLRHGKASHGIHDKQHISALITEVFRSGQGDITGPNAKRRRPVRGGDHDHRTLLAFGAQFMFEKAAHFAVALADQRNYGNVGGILPRHGAEQRAFPDAAAAE